jgi:hypothetical protein
MSERAEGTGAKIHGGKLMRVSLASTTADLGEDRPLTGGCHMAVRRGRGRRAVDTWMPTCR